MHLIDSDAVQHQQYVKQTLPDEKITIVHPPQCNPDEKQGEYLKKTSMGSVDRKSLVWYGPQDPPVSHNLPTIQFFGIPSSPVYPLSVLDEPIMVGLYIDNFINFGLSNDDEHWFETLLSKKIVETLMGIVNWLLGTHFTWAQYLPRCICAEPG